MYNNYSVTLTRSVFKVLLDALAAKVQEEWKDATIPFYSYKNRSNRRAFWGTKERNDAQNKKVSLYDYMKDNDEVKKCVQYNGKTTFRAKYMEERFNKYNRGAKTITFNDQPYNQIYFIYLEHNTLDAFLKSDYFEGKEAIVKEQERLSNNSAAEQWDKFYLCGLRISENKIIQQQIYIDFGNGISTNKMNVKLITPDGQKYIGAIIYQYPYLKLHISRNHTSSKTWMPFTIYFEVGETPEKLDVLVGTHSGVGYINRKAIAGVSVLIRQEKYEEYQQLMERFLFLSSHSTELKINNSSLVSKEASKALLQKKTSNKHIEPFVGTHELYDFGKETEKLLVSYLLKVEPNFSGTILSPDKDFIYRVQFSAEHKANTVFMHLKQKETHNALELLPFSNLIVIDTIQPLAKHGKTTFYAASCSGVNRKGHINSFPMLLVINPPHPHKKEYNKTTLQTEFFNHKGRSELNKEIFRKCLELERKRITMIEDLVKGIDV